MSSLPPSSVLSRLGYRDPVRAVDVARWIDGATHRRSEMVAEETPIAFVYNRIPYVVMMATPADLEDFALGFSITEELLRSPADLHGVVIERFSQGIEIQAAVDPACDAVIGSQNRRIAGRTGCGICGADSIAAVLKSRQRVTAVTVASTAVLRALGSLGEHQKLNAATGAVHAAAWASLEGEIVLVREDVGRHNALDKLIGAVLKAGLGPSSGFVAVTSRASFEMVQKAAALGAPLLAAISGPTGLAISVAEDSGLTLVGFARGSRLTAYTYPDRVI